MTEFINGGDLGSLIERKGILSEPEAKAVLRQIASAVRHMTEKNVVSAFVLWLQNADAREIPLSLCTYNIYVFIQSVCNLAHASIDLSSV